MSLTGGGCNCDSLCPNDFKVYQKVVYVLNKCANLQKTHIVK